MLFSRKNILATIALLLLSNNTFGYNFTFSNVTERILVICYKLESLPQEYYQILMPDQSVSYYFPNLHCFGGSILWAEYKAKDALGRDLPYHGGIDLVDPKSGEILKGTSQNLFKAEVANKYAFIPMQIKVVDNETFQKTINAAEELAQGIDSFICETLSTVKTFSNPFSSASSSMGVGMSSGTNTSKEGAISGAISNVINKIGDKISGDNKNKEISENDFVKVEADSVLNNLKELIEAHDAKAALFFMNRHKKDLLTVISENQFDSIHEMLETTQPEDLNATDYQDMLTTLNRNNTLNTHMATNTSSPMNMGSGMGINTSANKQCRFELGKIAKNGGTLGGISLCRDLHLAIVDTGEVGSPAPTEKGVTVSRVKKPILIAEINQGG